MEIQGIKYPYTEEFIKSHSNGYPNSTPVLKTKFKWDELEICVREEILRNLLCIKVENQIIHLEIIFNSISSIIKKWPNLDEYFELLKDQYGFEDEEIHPDFYAVNKEYKEFISVLNSKPKRFDGEYQKEIFQDFNKERIQIVFYRFYFIQSLESLQHFLSKLIKKNEPLILTNIPKRQKIKFTNKNENTYTEEDIKIIIALLDELKITDKGIYRLDEKKKSSIRAVLDALMLSNKITKVKQENGHKQIMTLVGLKFVKRLSKGSKIYEDHFEMAKKLIK